MRIATRDIPQADELEDVLRVVDAVSGGADTYQKIAEAIGKVERQGRYYRRAAEILGLIASGGPNRSVLTDLGRKYVDARGAEKRAVAVQAVLGTRVFQRVIPFLESRQATGCSSEEFCGFLRAVTESTSRTMMPRRASTLIGWLRSLGLVGGGRESCVLRALPDEMGAVAFSDEAEPLLPRTFDLAEYTDVQRRASANAGTISYIVDETRVERAAASHAMLTNLVAAKIRRAGGVPRYNGLVDMAATLQGTSFLFEMKSTTASNARSQVRHGVSQLYEYRYLQNAPGAQLVLVVENPLERELAWMCDYLVRDRGIMLVWDGDRRHLHCGGDLRDKLRFLVA